MIVSMENDKDIEYETNDFTDEELDEASAQTTTISGEEMVEIIGNTILDLQILGVPSSLKDLLVQFGSMIMVKMFDERKEKQNDI